MTRCYSLFCISLMLAASVAAQKFPAAHPRDAQIKDSDTRAWWHLTESISGDDMEGRDTGSAGYDRAAQLVVDHFKRDGLKPAGDNGTFYQRFPLHEVRVAKDGTSFVLIRESGLKGTIHQPYPFLQDISIRAAEGLPPSFEGELYFAGYCTQAEVGDVKGKIAICFGTHNNKLVTAMQRSQALMAAGALGAIVVDDPYFKLEPARWPIPYARAVVIADPDAPASISSFANMTLNSAVFAEFIDASGKDGKEILAKGGRGEPLESFDVHANLRVTLNIMKKDYSAKNVIAVLPGSDPKLKDEYVVIAAHLDGYGYGEPVLGDNLYNGTLDDAAYVALLMQFADRQHAAWSAKNAAPGFRRSILFCVFAGEEKGLLGSHWFTQHPTVPKEGLVADINLDQLRPLFPLNILTTLALDRSTLGQTVKDVATQMHIEVRPDREPERNLLMRADHWPFMQMGVPAVGFIFGYDKDSDAEKRYREWYNVRYHRPQDDLTQPVDFDAATKFNRFFYRLVTKVANADEKPQWITAKQ